MEVFPLGACQNRLAHRLVAMTRRKCDGEPKKRHSADCNGAQNSSTGLGKRIAEQVQNDEFLQARMDKFPTVTSE